MFIAVLVHDLEHFYGLADDFLAAAYERYTYSDVHFGYNRVAFDDYCRGYSEHNINFWHKHYWNYWHRRRCYRWCRSPCRCHDVDLGEFRNVK